MCCFFSLSIYVYMMYMDAVSICSHSSIIKAWHDGILMFEDRQEEGRKVKIENTHGHAHTNTRPYLRTHSSIITVQSAHLTEANSNLELIQFGWLLRLQAGAIRHFWSPTHSALKFSKKVPCTKKECVESLDVCTRCLFGKFPSSRRDLENGLNETMTMRSSRIKASRENASSFFRFLSPGKQGRS